MQVTNSVTPSPERIQTLLGTDLGGPVSMLNLLKFKQRAEYADGRDTALTGAEAYGLYAAEMRKIVEAGGGRFVFSGQVKGLVLGDVEELWDAVGIVEYPSKQGFVDIVSAPEVREISVHRQAGLAGQLLMALDAGVGIG